MSPPRQVLPPPCQSRWSWIVPLCLPHCPPTATPYRSSRQVRHLSGPTKPQHLLNNPHSRESRGSRVRHTPTVFRLPSRLRRYPSYPHHLPHQSQACLPPYCQTNGHPHQEHFSAQSGRLCSVQPYRQANLHIHPPSSSGLPPYQQPYRPHLSNGGSCHIRPWLLRKPPCRLSCQPRCEPNLCLCSSTSSHQQQSS